MSRFVVFLVAFFSLVTSSYAQVCVQFVSDQEILVNGRQIKPWATGGLPGIVSYELQIGGDNTAAAKNGFSGFVSIVETKGVFDLSKISIRSSKSDPQLAFDVLPSGDSLQTNNQFFLALYGGGEILCSEN